MPRKDSKGVGGHQRPYEGYSEEWLTPPSIIKALGPFDLDPCAPEERLWPTARKHFTKKHDGLKKTWRGLAWVNPPYGTVKTGIWLNKLAEHGNGIALVFARTETRIFHRHVWEKADALLFLEGRIHFHWPDGTRATFNSGAPSVLVAYGEKAVNRLLKSKLKGAIVRLRK